MDSSGEQMGRKVGASQSHVVLNDKNVESYIWLEYIGCIKNLILAM